jgi:two-component sensor histidine kinase
MGDWHGADIRDLIRTHLAPFHNLGDNSVLFEGPELKLNPKAAEQIGLALHELGTNAVKHGALSVPTGVVTIRWGLETGDAQKPVLRILTEIVPESLRGTASLAFEPEGVKWVLLASSSSVLA